MEDKQPRGFYNEPRSGGSYRPPRRNRTLIVVLLCVAIGIMVAAIVVTVYWQGQLNQLRPGQGASDVRKEYTATAEDVESIQVEAVIEDVRIERGSGDSVQVRQYANGAFREQYLASMDLHGSVLTVRSGLANAVSSCLGSGMWGASSQIVVSIPERCVPDVLASSTAGSVRAQDVEARHMALSCTSNGAQATGIRCEQLEVASVSGGADAQDVHCDDITVSATSGSASATDIDAKAQASVSAVSGSASLAGSAGEAIVSSTSGSVQGSLRSAGTLDASSTSGSVRIEVEDASELKSVSCESVSGSVSLSLPAGTAVSMDFESMSGELDTGGANGLELSSSGIPVKISTTSGSASLRTLP